MANDAMYKQMSAKPGFVAALDQSGGSTPGALRAYGIPDSAWHGDEAEMFRLMHEMRVRIMTSPSFTGAKVIATVPIGMGVDGAGFDPSTGDAFATNADGTLTVVHLDATDRYRVVQTLTTPVRSRNLGLDPSRHRLFVAAARFGAPPPGGRGRGPMIPGSFELLEIGRWLSTAGPANGGR